MTDSYWFTVAQQALYLVLLVSAPPVLASLAVGLLMGALQTTTQIHDQALSSAPRIAAVLGSLALAGPWIGTQLVSFSQLLLQGIHRF